MLLQKFKNGKKVVLYIFRSAYLLLFSELVHISYLSVMEGPYEYFSISGALTNEGTAQPVTLRF